MNISFNTRIPIESIGGFNGYGSATKAMLNSLISIGYDVSIDNPEAEIGLCFDQPQYAKFYPGQYKILYLPWESTLLQPGWAEILNSCDEVWTPSPLIAKWFKEYNNINVPIYVYEHGIEKEWFDYTAEKPVDNFRFLTIGAESRKNGWQAISCFRKGFAGIDEVSFTFKTIGQTWNKLPSLGRINYFNEKISPEELKTFISNYHAYVYLSSGEGFGLTPLQAMSMGMPTICVDAWAPYADLLDPELCVKSELKTTWMEDIHPGKIFSVDFNDAQEKMRHLYNNYDYFYERAQNRVEEIKIKYDWDTLTREAFSGLMSRLNNKSTPVPS